MACSCKANKSSNNNKANRTPARTSARELLQRTALLSKNAGVDKNISKEAPVVAKPQNSDTNTTQTTATADNRVVTQRRPVNDPRKTPRRINRILK